MNDEDDIKKNEHLSAIVSNGGVGMSSADYYDDWGVPDPIAAMKRQLRDYERVLKMCEQDSHKMLVTQLLDQYDVKR